jgi:hypothetical protein
MTLTCAALMGAEKYDMQRRDRVRRALILCSHCLRNIAFYRVGWRRRECRRRDQFWLTVNGNFLDHAVLEWCKLFADRKGQHHWRKVVSKPIEFERDLLNRMKLNSDEFEAYTSEMRAYRNKFVAHLDAEPIMQIPRLRLARMSVAFLYDYLLTNEDDGGFFPERPFKAYRYYLLHMNVGRAEYVD